MLIRLDGLLEGHTYELVKAIDSDSIAELIDASFSSNVELLIQYVWVSEELRIKLSSRYRIYAHCDLCFEKTETECSCSIEDTLTEQSAEYRKAENAFDIRPIIDECIVLALAREVKCSPNCKGVCKSCGKNLNKGSCSCTKEADNSNPFGVLKDLLITGGAKNGSTKKKNI